MLRIEYKKEILAGIADLHCRKESAVFQNTLFRAGLDLDVEVTKLTVLFLADDAVNLLVVHQGHVNVETAAQEFTDGNIFLPFAERCG